MGKNWDSGSTHPDTGVSDRLQALVASGELKSDPAQKAMAARFDRLLQDLHAQRPARKSSALGWLFASTEEIVGIKTGMGLSYGAGAQVRIFDHAGGPFWVLGELWGLAHSRFESAKESPAELIFAAKTSYKDWTFFLGLGPGLSRGYGEPNVRVFAGATWAWQKPPPPSFRCSRRRLRHRRQSQSSVPFWKTASPNARSSTRFSWTCSASAC